MLDEIGTELVQNALETADEMIRDSVKRKKDWYVQRKGDKKTILDYHKQLENNRRILPIFGELIDIWNYLIIGTYRMYY